MAVRSRYVPHLPGFGLGRTPLHLFSTNYNYFVPALSPLRRTTLRCGPCNPAGGGFFITPLWHSAADDYLSARGYFYRIVEPVCRRRTKPPAVVDGSSNA